MMMKENAMAYDLAIIGGGPAGYSAAFEATRLGLRAILFEERELGGTCLNRGCVPTKFLAHVAELFDSPSQGKNYGIHAEKPILDFLAAKDREREIVSELREGLGKSLRQKKIEVRYGKATIEGKNCVICNGERCDAKNLFIATGSTPARPFAVDALTSDEALALPSVPRSLKIIGGGAIAVEFAHIFSLLGTDVTVAIRGARILQKWDKEIAVALTQNFKKRGIKILANCSQDQLCDKTSDVMLSAIGRMPNLGGVDLSFVDLDENGAIKVDGEFRTRTPNVFAAGDVISGSPMLAHTAMEQGRAVARIVAGEEAPTPSAVVSCLYTSPEAASVGMTEAGAKEAGIPYVLAKQNMRSNARTLIDGEDRGFVKLLADRDSGKLIGAQLFCGRASDIADELALAMNHGFTAKDLLFAARPHPSYCEAITEAAESLLEKLG